MHTAHDEPSSHCTRSLTRFHLCLGTGGHRRHFTHFFSKQRHVIGRRAFGRMQGGLHHGGGGGKGGRTLSKGGGPLDTAAHNGRRRHQRCLRRRRQLDLAQRTGLGAPVVVSWGKEMGLARRKNIHGATTNVLGRGGARDSAPATGRGTRHSPPVACELVGGSGGSVWGRNGLVSEWSMGRAVVGGRHTVD